MRPAVLVLVPKWILMIHLMECTIMYICILYFCCTCVKNVLSGSALCCNLRAAVRESKLTKLGERASLQLIHLWIEAERLGMYLILNVIELVVVVVCRVVGKQQDVEGEGWKKTQHEVGQVWRLQVPSLSRLPDLQHPGGLHPAPGEAHRVCQVWGQIRGLPPLRQSGVHWTKAWQTSRKRDCKSSRQKPKSGSIGAKT